MKQIGDEEWLEQKLKQLSKTLQDFSGERFLAALTLALTKTLKMRHAFIGEALNNGKTVRALYSADRNNSEKPFNYETRDMPCSLVLKGEPVVVPCNLSQLFKGKKDSGLESYVGQPLFNKSNDVIGLCVVADEGVLVGERRIQSLLAELSHQMSRELEGSE